MIEILKNITIILIVFFTLFSIKRLAVNFNAWWYEREHRSYLKSYEECKKEQERKYKE